MVEPHSFGSDDLGAQISLRDLLTIVFKRRNLILSFALSVFAVVTLLTMMAKPTYRINATLLVNKARAEVPLAASDSRQLIISQVSEQDLNSEIEILRSRSLLEEALKRLDTDTKAEPKSGWLSGAKTNLKKILGRPELSKFDSKVLQLQAHLSISPVRKTNVISIDYESDDPVWAHAVVETITECYLEKRAEMYRSPQAVNFFEEQMNSAEARLDENEAQLETFVEDASITMVKGPQGSDSLGAQKALVMQRLSSLESSLGDAEAQFQSQQQEVASLASRLSQEPERLESSNRLNQDAATEEIERALATLRLERDRLLQDFKPDSRFVRDVETQIELAESRLEEARNEAGVEGTETNPVYLQLKSDLVRAEANLEGSRARISSLRSQVLEYRRTLENLNLNGFEIENLRREIQVAEEDYLLYRKKHEEARISAAMDQERLINVTVAQPAQMPLRPESRGLMTRMMLALIVGFAGGLGIAFALEQYIDRSLTTANDVERRLGVPHLASIPYDVRTG